MCLTASVWPWREADGQDAVLEPLRGVQRPQRTFEQVVEHAVEFADDPDQGVAEDRHAPTVLPPWEDPGFLGMPLALSECLPASACFENRSNMSVLQTRFIL